MEPPSYEEARFHPPALSSQGYNIPPPPSYDVSLHAPPTPPPTYGEAVTVQPDPFPVLTPPRLPTSASSPSQNTGVIIHPTTQIGVSSSSVGRRQTQPVVTQPQPVPVTLSYLEDNPAVVHCPHCRHVVTSKVTYQPGKAAWCMCILLTLMGLVCGFCLIPFMVRSLQDAHHSCPNCGKHLYTYTR
ncbi:lipopolysaccharide-induced tumor necrosis factor-alpha factor homolog [Xyrichtys novacula]|uniref:Lipopolysaccharide-induced tumor necrosis factor-alpha factor homolog n=1 Tax=Xyrichtys novacula TaxID=13765 RepID=A0AAV1EVA4_XYRNO|nr:lipopolysaccharide-induced tumor necrosis factor-alpha factor homolog [Xyrichtys novacula]